MCLSLSEWFVSHTKLLFPAVFPLIQLHEDLAATPQAPRWGNECSVQGEGEEKLYKCSKEHLIALNCLGYIEVTNGFHVVVLVCYEGEVCVENVCDGHFNVTSKDRNSWVLLKGVSGRDLILRDKDGYHTLLP